MSLITIDIETCATQNPERRASIAAAVTEEMTTGLEEKRNKIREKYSKPETIAKHLADLQEPTEEEIVSAVTRTIAETALNASTGELFCIGMAINDAPPQIVYRQDCGGVLMKPGKDFVPLKGEFDMLATFFEHIGSPVYNPATYCGHNLLDFDMRFIWQRAIILKIPPFHGFSYALQGGRYSKGIFDTMTRWAGFNAKISLNDLAGTLGLPGKDDVAGWMVPGMIEDLRGEEVLRYCRSDVEQTRRIAFRLGAS